ncbi:hypothetical protein RRG08_018693 [Elysia crispata]|uniref:Transposase n=1 Tax=Elysia crispata TaxID=231223 RepID=A0AAE0YEM8_9GAST|nr:hypothetical protein RRG08_018693 [Elysia crispata]
MHIALLTCAVTRALLLAFRTSYWLLEDLLHIELWLALSDHFLINRKLNLSLRRFILALDPQYEITERKKITQVFILRLYKKEEALKKELENTEHIALTTDEWTSRTTKGYMAVTARFIDIAVRSSRDKANNIFYDIGKYKG